MPTSIVKGPGNNFLVGCGDHDGEAFPPNEYVIDGTSGAILATIDNVGGVDETWYNPGDNRYYLAARDMPTGAVMGDNRRRLEPLAGKRSRPAPTRTASRLIPARTTCLCPCRRARSAPRKAPMVASVSTLDSDPRCAASASLGHHRDDPGLRGFGLAITLAYNNRCYCNPTSEPRR